MAFAAGPYNVDAYDEMIYDALATGATPVADFPELQFNDFALNDSSVDLCDASIMNRAQLDFTAKRKLNIQPIPRDNGVFITSDFMREKVIRISGTLVESTNCLLETRIKDFQRAMQKRQGFLDYKVCIDGSDTIRRWVATLINGDRMFPERGAFDVKHIDYELEFLVDESFGKDLDYSSTEFNSVTSLTDAYDVTNAGTSTGKPIIVLNFLAASGITQIDVVNNTRDSETITITESISALDYVSIDAENFVVTINGTEKDYDGFFPSLDADTPTNSFTVTTTGTSNTYDLTFKWKNRYLR